MPQITPSDVVKQMGGTYSLAVTTVVAAIVSRHNSGQITETQAQKLIDRALANALPLHVDPYQTRVPPEDTRRLTLRHPGKPALTDVIG